jgi:hypothetical protein
VKGTTFLGRWLPLRDELCLGKVIVSVNQDCPASTSVSKDNMGWVADTFGMRDGGVSHPQCSGCVAPLVHLSCYVFLTVMRLYTSHAVCF